MIDAIERRFRRLVPNVDFCSLRVVDERTEQIEVRQDVLQPVREQVDLGAMVTVLHRGGLGYAATSDLSEAGLDWALRRAREWAERTARSAVFDWSRLKPPEPSGEYATPVRQTWEQVPLPDKVDLLRKVCTTLKVDERIVDWSASLLRIRQETFYFTSGGGRVFQRLEMLVPDLTVIANQGDITQKRSMGSRGTCRQGGLEILEEIGFGSAGHRLAEEALQLLSAPDCPTGRMDLVLAPDQMILQLHESIGHPLELDRILGDERNYAGQSFVTPEMFGAYRYGSELLNVTFDPECIGEFASYAFDDEGARARRTYLIERGILRCPLGGIASQTRAGLPGTANSRASSWNRPPIDRMANLNIEPGDSTLDELIAGVERGVFMRTNTSWSIDDSRNKFQFGCEWGRLIEDGQLTTVVRNPNYRGVSATFWRNLTGVGDRSTVEVLGSPYCGKGEPNQLIRVGHAAPACRFRDVAVFGGA